MALVMPVNFTTPGGRERPGSISSENRSADFPSRMTMAPISMIRSALASTPVVSRSIATTVSYMAGS
jgi:hypothetical protein